MLDELVAGVGPVHADQDLLPEPGRDLADRRGQHVPMISERVRPALAPGARPGGADLAVAGGDLGGGVRTG